MNGVVGTRISMEELIRRVGELMDSDLSFEAAIEGVHSEIATEIGLEEFWAEIGPEILRKALAPSFRNRGKQGPMYRSNVPKKRPSWRAVFRKSPEVVWDIEIPVGLTGQKKKIGEFTRDDVREVEEYYSGQIQVLTTRREYWTRIRKKLRDGDTIRTAYDDGRIREADLGFARRSQEDLMLSKIAGEERG